MTYSLLILLLFLFLLNYLFSNSTNSNYSSDDLEELDGMTKDISFEEKDHFEFQTEVSRLMDIIINSLYKESEIFLRELISNASDALDKLRYLKLSDPEYSHIELDDLELQISFDRERKIIRIKDNGIGMTRQELIENLGTIAKSGAAEFIEQYTKGENNQIGQFGVGFYSVFLVSKHVKVISKTLNDDQYIWESSADQKFSVYEDPRGSTFDLGTEVIIYLKKDSEYFADQDRLIPLIKKYSEFINYPIMFYKSTFESYYEKIKDKLDANKEVIEVEPEELPESERNIYFTRKQKEVWDWVQINTSKAIWLRPKSDVTDDEYVAFFQNLTKTEETPFSWIHFNAEGETEFKSILYIPRDFSADVDLEKMKKYGLRLYVKKVLISADFSMHMPRHLAYITGVIDSDDLQINVSRETVQRSKLTKIIVSKVTKKVTEMIRKMHEEYQNAKTHISEAKESGISPDEHSTKAYNNYLDFHKRYSKVLKVGISQDAKNSANMVKFLLYYSNNSKGELISIEEYIDSVPDSQEYIYYVVADNIKNAESNSFLDKFNSQNIPVLYFLDPMDEFYAAQLSEFEGRKFISIDHETSITDEDKKKRRARDAIYKEKFGTFMEHVRDILPKRYVRQVIISHKLSTVPMSISIPENSVTPGMARLLKYQAFVNNELDPTQLAKISFNIEINPRHPIILRLLDLWEDNVDNKMVKDCINIMYFSSLFNTGYEILIDRKDLKDRFLDATRSILDVHSNELEPELDVESEEEEEELLTSAERKARERRDKVVHGPEFNPSNHSEVEPADFDEFDDE